ncbi:MAG TPA: sodium/solute symporter [Candidatus Anammoximicrobium sp.]|nr:sodium/solute symporter [Candidatus Anammoximicrobium sp.]
MLRNAVSLILGCFLAGCVASSLPAEAADTSATWSSLPALPDAEGFAGMFAGVGGETLLVAGGANFPGQRPWEGGTKAWYDSIYALSAGAAAWTNAGKLPRPLAYGVSVQTDRGVLCAGGADAAKHYADSFLMQWKSGSVAIEPLPPLPQPCAYFCGAQLGKVVYVAGGTVDPQATSALKTFWALDLADARPQWRTLEPWPGAARMLAVAGVQADAFHLFGGADLTAGPDGKPVRRYLRDAYRFTPQAGWRRIADVPRPVVAAPSPAPAIGQSHLFIFSGDDGTKVNFQPQAEHPGFPADILAYHTITDTWITLGEMPSPRVTTPAVPWRGRWVIPSGEIRPGVRSPEVWSFQPQPKRTAFGWLNYTALAAYLAGVVAIGIYFSRFNRTTDDFFRGGQSIPWWAAALSIYATVLSSITYMALPGLGYGTNWNLFVQNSYIIILPLVALVYLPFYRRLNLTCAYEYLEQRFNVGTRLVASVLFIIFQCGRTAIVLYLPALALATVANFDLTTCILLMGVLCIVYTVAGGIEAVIWTDVAQTIVLMGGAVFGLVIAVMRIDGGVPAVFEQATAQGKFFETLDWNWDIAAGTAWTVILGAVFHNLFAYTASQDVVQRYFTTPDQKSAARAIWTNAVLVAPAQALFFAIGTVLFVYYRQHPERLDPVFQTDAIFPLFIVREMPVGIAGLVVAGIFAAAQSTLSSSLNSVATAYVTDFHRRFRVAASDQECLKVARLVTVLVGVVGMGAALWIARSDVRSLFEAFLNVIGMFGGTISGLFILGIFTRRANGAGALVGALVSASVVWLVHTHVHFYWFAFTGIATCVVVGYLTSLCFPRANKDISGLALGTRAD